MVDGSSGAKTARARRAPTTPDPIEIAMERAAHMGADDVALGLLADQRRLVRWQIAGERAGFALKVLTGLAGVAVAGVLGFMAWTASQDRSVVIDPLRAPADLAQQGFDGPALANALQDKLAALQAQTPTSYFTSAEVRNRAPAEVRVQIPATGVSISDLDQALRFWLGRQRHVSGELARVTSGPQAGALALSIRVSGQPGERLVQPDGDLDALLGRAAELAYAGVDPLRSASLLIRRGRTDETQAQLRRVAYGPWPDDVRAQAFQMLQSDPGLRDRLAERRKLLLEAMRLSGGRVGLNDLGVVENGLGHSEAALRYYRESLRSGPGDARLMTSDARTRLRLVTEGNIAGMTADYAKAFGLPCHLLRIAACSGEAMAGTVLAQPALLNDFEANYRVASATRSLAVLHQPSMALRIIAIGRRAAAANAEAIGPAKLVRESDWLTPQIEAHRQLQDWRGVLDDYRQFEANAAQRRVEVPINIRAYRALALAQTGDWAGARAAAAGLPGDCMRCVWYRALIADLAGDAKTADALFADVVRQAPSLPFAKTDWARSLLARGDMKGAIAHAAHAHKTSKSFADPLEIWGEALLAKGDARGAARKFEAAAKLTPRWGRLHMKWGQALAKLGKAEEARAQWKLAAPMDLTPAERAELTPMLPRGEHL